MKIQQVSVFVENRVGRLRAPCDTLAEAGINIVTLSLADTAQYGILRLIVREPRQAVAVLEAKGFVVKVTEVLAIEVADRPGGLAEVLHAIEDAGINVEYMYAFAEKLGDTAVLVFRVNEPDEAIRALAESKVSVLDHVKLYERFERAS